MKLKQTRFSPVFSAFSQTTKAKAILTLSHPYGTSLTMKQPETVMWIHTLGAAADG